MTEIKMREYLRNIQKDLEDKGLAYFIVIESATTNVGASIYNGKNKLDGAATNARNAHTKWEMLHDIDTKHNWANEAIRPEYLNW